MTGPLGMSETALPYDDYTTLPEPFARGYMSRACVEEFVRDGAEPLPDDTDTTDWNASYGQIGGSMHSTLADMGTWAASMSGSALLSDELAAERLEMHDANLGVFTYGLGITEQCPAVGAGGDEDHERLATRGVVAGPALPADGLALVAVLGRDLQNIGVRGRL